MATIQMDFYSKCLERLIPVTAIVPVEGAPGSTPRPDKFPAIYLLHGYSGICTDWVYGSRINELAMQYSVAVFCPSGENAFYLNDEVSGNRYADLVGEELVELSRRLFPISEKKEDTVIAGFSMGGYGALRNGLVYDKTFGSVFAFSSALITDRLAKMKPGEIDQMKKSEGYYSRLFGTLADIPGSDKDPVALADKYVKQTVCCPIFIWHAARRTLE